MHVMYLISLQYDIPCCRKIFDAFIDQNASEFSQILQTLCILQGISVTLDFLGAVVLELFARRTMQELFKRFFEHIVYQVHMHILLLAAGKKLQEWA